MTRLLGEFGGTEELANQPPINWLIPNWLPNREMSVLYGAPGTFKSFVAQAWSCQLSLAGHRCLYVAAEGLSGLRPRVDAWRARNLGDAYAEMPNWSFYNANVWMDQDDARQNWVDGLLEYCAVLAGSDEARRVKKKLPNLIIIDTLARNFLGDENSAKDMGMFVEGVERIRRALGCAILVVHHTTKSNKNVERGTESLRAASFAMFRTSKAQQRPRRKGGSVLLTCDRMKDGETPQEIRLDFDRFDLDADEHGQVYRYSLAMGKFPPVGGNLPTPTKGGSEFPGAAGSGIGSLVVDDEILGREEDDGDQGPTMEATMVLAHGLNEKLTRTAVMSLLECGGTKAKNLLKALVIEGFLEKKGDRAMTYYDLTDLGRDQATKE